MVTRTQSVLMLIEAVHPLTHGDIMRASGMNTGLTSRVIGRLMGFGVIRRVNVAGSKVRHYEPMGLR